jgi:transposase-like protein
MCCHEKTKHGERQHYIFGLSKPTPARIGWSPPITPITTNLCYHLVNPYTTQGSTCNKQHVPLFKSTRASPHASSVAKPIRGRERELDLIDVADFSSVRQQGTWTSWKLGFSLVSLVASRLKKGAPILYRGILIVLEQFTLYRMLHTMRYLCPFFIFPSHHVSSYLATLQTINNIFLLCKHVNTQ